MKRNHQGTRSFGKLRLDRQTLHTLDEKQLGRVEGGHRPFCSANDPEIPEGATCGTIVCCH